ncbi:hypothetical protein SAMN04488109_3201 [Chryseolinea serpens]|uniref:DUF4412 domain-containing protein n=1 Tax=Chryseolinea serpens TaxID=947013 RepID=A0A1M5R5R4_9BACT|nr:hypothetical protein [Chryseolinea serpens]SHH21518.1 hypothetical protein SAMN04488109_3201 [Chryseolinea serpens]
MTRLLTLLLLCTTLLSQAQSFEGTLVYKADYEVTVSEKMKASGITAEKIIDRMKSDGSYIDTVKSTYKKGNYRSEMNSHPSTWVIYRNDANKLYTFQDGEAKDICTVTDMSIDLEFQLTGKKPVITKLDTTVNVGGTPCEVVRVKWQSGSYDYYFNKTKNAIDPTLYAKHVYDGWADYLSIAKALPIKIVKRVGKLSVITLTLVAQKTGPVDDALFKIPKLAEDKDLNMIKMPGSEMMRIK